MFKHILIATDGSAPARRAAVRGVRLAKEHGARVTGYCSVPPLRQEFYGADIGRDPRLARIKQRAMAVGEKHVAAIGRAARAAGVPFRPLVENAASVSLGICEAARRAGCDLIVMSSHGRSGLKKLILGSVTSQVLAQSKVPVLVYR